MTAQENREEQKRQNKLVLQYMPLVDKISFQLWSQLSDRQKELFNFEEVKGYALEGFAKALRNYDPSRSEMTFKQYLAYAMRNTCLDGINEESRTIKISYYKQQKRKEEGLPNILTTSINGILSRGDSEEDDSDDHLDFLGVNDGFENCEHPIDTLVKVIKAKFDPSYADIFFSTYGLDGHDELKGVELAEKYKVSNATITVRVQKVISFIREDKTLMSILAELL